MPEDDLAGLCQGGYEEFCLSQKDGQDMDKRRMGIKGK